jgi:hypothetical protein
MPPGTSIIDDKPCLTQLSFGQMARIDQGCGCDNRGSMLVVMEDGNIHQLAQPAFDDEAFRALDILKVNATERGAKQAVLDGAGWHTSQDLAVPPNLTLLHLPPYSPELNPVERVWLYLRERHPSHRLHDGYTAVVDAISSAWCELTPDRLRSLCAYPWIRQVIE